MFNIIWQKANPYKLYVVVAALVFFVFLLAAWHSATQRQHYHENLIAEFASVQQAKQQVLQQEVGHQLEIAVKLIAADRQLTELILQAAARYQQEGANADLSSLRQQIAPILDRYWQTLTPSGASQLHLHLAPDAFTLLRAHRPERHSDSLANVRPMIMHSLNTAMPVTATEQGRHGLGLRSVVPVFNQQQQMVAAIELGFDLQNVFAQRQGPGATAAPYKVAEQGIALLVKSEITEVFHPDIRKDWLQTEMWSTYNPSDMLQFWLENYQIKGTVAQATQQILHFNQHTFVVSLQPWPVWGETLQQSGQLVSISWQDISSQISAQQRAETIIWSMWLLAGVVTLLLGIWLVLFLRRQARREVSGQQKLLKQSEQKLSALYQLSPLPILLNRFSDGAFVEANPAMEQLVGYKPEELKQLSYWDLTPECYADAEQQQLKALTETGRYGPYIKQYKHKNGELIDIELSGVLFSDAKDETFIWTIIKDISDIKRIEKLKDDFVSTVSHELRTPLTSIGGSLGLVLGGAAGELSPKAAKLLSIAHKNSQRLNILINDLLDIEKLVAGKMEFNEAEVPLLVMLEDVKTQIQPYAEQYQVSIKLDIKDNVKLWVDQSRIQQVLANFLSNAIKFSPKGGEVLLSTALNAQRVRISVADNGPGIAEIDQHRLFKRFSQLEQNTEKLKSGTGLGLAISREIILQAGGEVGVSSVPGQGATFWFELPVYQVPVFKDADNAILVIEDDADTAHLLCEFLKAENYASDWAPDISTAWQKLAKRQYSALTLDLKLKDENGADFFLRLRDNPATANLPVLIISAHIEQGKLLLAAIANALDWIEKPISPEMLSLKLGQLLSQLPRLDRVHRILHVEDDHDIVTIMRLQLEQLCEYQAVASLAAAKKILQQQFDLILLDLGLPDGDGISLLSTISATQGDIPVVIFSAQDVTPDNTARVKAVFSKSRINTEVLAKYLKNMLN
ncbi:response regulator [Arsukibacterium ikkense]|uniref:response regulator n=1 Tax=Arsukibacterium ikkense TaxID=336831 RepID=UPI00069C8D7E|nr:response regulator [Arsukibacterium ikkense]